MKSLWIVFERNTEHRIAAEFQGRIKEQVEIQIWRQVEIPADPIFRIRNLIWRQIQERIWDKP